jgi:ZipA, C-terminal FtsZ-binding domain
MSNTLTLSLAIVGGIVLAALVAHNAWATRQSRIRRPDRQEPKESALEPASVATPTPANGASSPDGGFAASREAVNPNTFDEAAGHAFSATLSSPLSRKAVQRIDALIDAIAMVALEHPLSGDHLIAHLPGSHRAGSKPMLFEGLSVDSGEWMPLQAGQSYSEVQVGVLMANRTGAINDIEYSEFVQKVQTFADDIGATADVPDMLEVVASAKELDAFASAHDAQMAMRLVARNSAWSVGFLQQQANKHGLVPGALPGRMVLPASQTGAPPLLVCQFDSHAALADDPDQAGLRVVHLSLDVPQTASEEAPFQRWCETAQALADSLDAVMVDDQEQIFSPQAFEAIGQDLVRLYEALAQRDLAAGSAAARRLFS